MTELRFELMTFGFDTMLNHHLSQKLKQIGKSKFNHLINTLTIFKQGGETEWTKDYTDFALEHHV
jgi:hypothetical protein